MNPRAWPSFEHLHSPEVSLLERGNALHAWYQYLAEHFRNPGWMFMNFGYADPERSAAAVVAGANGNPLAVCAELYLRVAEPLEVRGKRLLEVGCGRGGGAFTLMKRLKPAFLAAIDLSSHAIELCRRNFQVPGLEFRTGDAENIPYPDESFDGVLNVESSHGYPRFDRFLAEVHRILVPAGRFALADARPTKEIQSWQDQLARAGFQVVDSCDISSNVLAALRLTSAFKEAFVTEHVAPCERDHFREFIGVEGSWYFETLRRGEMSYRRFLLQKNAERSSGNAHSAA